MQQLSEHLFRGLDDGSRLIFPAMKPGAIIKQARTKKGWSQQRLADQVGVSGVAIKKIEAGDTRQSKFLPRIAAALDLELSELDTSLRNLKAHASHIEPAAAPENHFQHQAASNDPARMPFLRTKGDGYRVDPSKASGAVKKFFDQHMAEGREAWHLTTNLLDAGECQPGSYLVVELGTQPEPSTVVLAVTPDNVPLFRLYVGQKLIPAPLIADDTPVLDEGRDARVLGVVVACWTPGQ